MSFDNKVKMSTNKESAKSAPKTPVRNARKQKYKELLDIGGICSKYILPNFKYQINYIFEYKYD